MRHKNERGQAILEAAIILPLFVFVCLGLADLQWCLGRVSNLEYVVNETARCQAISGLPCTDPSAATKYAFDTAKKLRMEPPQLVMLAVGCDLVLGTCAAEMSYHYHPLGVYFPDITIERTGTAALPKP